MRPDPSKGCHTCTRPSAHTHPLIHTHDTARRQSGRESGPAGSDFGIATAGKQNGARSFPETWLLVMTSARSPRKPRVAPQAWRGLQLLRQRGDEWERQRDSEAVGTAPATASMVTTRESQKLRSGAPREVLDTAVPKGTLLKVVPLYRSHASCLAWRVGSWGPAGGMEPALRDPSPLSEPGSRPLQVRPWG